MFWLTYKTGWSKEGKEENANNKKLCLIFAFFATKIRDVKLETKFGQGVKKHAYRKRSSMALTSKIHCTFSMIFKTTHDFTILATKILMK